MPPFLAPYDLGGNFVRRQRTKPSRSQIASAMYSATVKCPGANGKNFIATKAKAATDPKIATTRKRVAGSTYLRNTSTIDTQAASQPNADAAEPTSVTGTSNES